MIGYRFLPPTEEETEASFFNEAESDGRTRAEVYATTPFSRLAAPILKKSRKFHLS